ncbi:MAG: phospholipid carrier-dependent glycosyltransferase [bacterium]|nr:phospholipid carrier-dependent glycosyltransferase [bacterium]
MSLKIKKEKAVIFLFLLISIASFFGFGLYHLTKFETTDEHLWKYGRIKQYWKAIEERNWKKTYINDKPGVTIALFSGIGLLFEPEPESHRAKNNLFTIFDVNRTERINFVFRFPILLLATLSLFLFFWLIRKAFDSDWLALFSTMFIALNPILIGITQVINPDSFLWIFGGLSVFSYLAFLNKKENKFLLMTGIFTGFALLSKYTALILLVLYLLFLLSKIIFKGDDEKNKMDYKFILREILNLFFIFAISIAIFILFLPAIFVEPSYLTKGVAQFFKRGNLTGFIFFAIFILGLIGYFRKKFFDVAVKFLSDHRKKILIVICSLFSLLLVLMVINVWSGQKLIPFDQLRDMAYAQEPKKFNFGKMLKDISFLEKNIKLFLLEAYPFIFSLTPINFILIIFLLMKAILKKIKNSSSAILFPVILFSLLYFLMTLTVRVVANVRYTVTLQFLFAIISSVALLELLDSLKLKGKKYLIFSAFFVLIFGIYSLWSIKPFYFSYENVFLPKKFTINSTWGNGFYEAAEYLNSKPNSENLIIYSNSATICPFFKGKCLSSRKIDLNVVRPDYFIISKRGELKEKNKFIFTNSDYQGKPSDYYFDNLENNYEWAIFIGDRQENYVKVVKFEN